MLDENQNTEHLDALTDKANVLEQLDVKMPLGDLMQRYFAAYFLEHKDHLPIGHLYETVFAEVETALFTQTLLLTENNQKKAADILGINRNTLRRKLNGA